MSSVNKKPIIFLNKFDPPIIYPKVPIIEYRRKDNGNIMILPEGTKNICEHRDGSGYIVLVEPLYKFEGEFIKPLN